MAGPGGDGGEVHPIDGKAGVWYPTGDLIRVTDAGELAFPGRIERQIKVRGVRVEPGEIEAVVGRHPAVENVVVNWDSSGSRLTAFVVPRGDNMARRAELRAFVGQYVAREMVPQELVFLPELPLTVHGKVDRLRLRNASADPPRTRASVHPESSDSQ